jgi:hypothetical protein
MLFYSLSIKKVVFLLIGSFVIRVQFLGVELKKVGRGEKEERSSLRNSFRRSHLEFDVKSHDLIQFKICLFSGVIDLEITSIKEFNVRVKIIRSQEGELHG